MSYPSVPALPQAPQRGDTPTNYADIADAFTAALPGFQAGCNLLAAWMQSTAADVQSYATTAVNAPGTTGTSTTSLTISASSKSLTIQTGKTIVPGMSVIIASTASPTNRMIGVVTSYTTGTGALVVSVVTIEGSGTFAAWTVSLSGAGAMNPVTAAQLALKAPLDNPSFTTGLVCSGQISTSNSSFRANGYAGVGTNGIIFFGSGGSFLYKFGNLFRLGIEGIGEAVIDKAGTVAMLGDVAVSNSPSVMTALNAGGSAPIYACRAWINFNGTGTPAINAGGNILGITDNGTGNYTINFSTPFPDANYTIEGWARGSMGSASFIVCADSTDTKTASAAQIRVRWTDSKTAADSSEITLSFVR